VPQSREHAFAKRFGSQGAQSLREFELSILQLLVLRKYLKLDPKVQIVNVHGVGFKLVVDRE